MANVGVFGGNVVKQLKHGKQGKEVFGTGPYEYFMYETRAEDDFCIDHLQSFSVYVLHKPQHATLSVDGVTEVLESGDRVQAEQRPVKMTVRRGPVKLLVAGTVVRHPANTNDLSFARHAALYKVTKPWGHELWINGQHPCYALKQIYIRAGTKTSLQYHRLKQETNVLFEGHAKLHYKSNPAVDNDLVSPADTASVDLEPVSSVDVVPTTLHRLEAVTDILLYETSTPHLDDVIRVSDDAKRPSGRLEKEHGR